MADRQPPDSRPGPPVDPGDAVATLLAQGVGTVYPAAGLLCRLGRDTLRQDAVGEASLGTCFDLASLTKALCTSLLCLRALSQGRLRLDEMPLPGVSVAALLRHESGLPAWLPLFAPDSSAAEAAAAPLPTPSQALRQAALARARSAPRGPAGQRAVYSDLGFIVLAGLLEDRLGERLDVAFSRLADRLSVEIAFRPLDQPESAQPIARARCAPTRRESPLREPLHGEVHDDNARAMLGVSGHAGLFGTLAAVGDLAAALLDCYHHLDSPAARALGIDPAVLRAAWALPAAVVDPASIVGSAPGSTWGLGWDHPSPPSASPSAVSSAGSLWPRSGVGHLGFTGCSLWIDPGAQRKQALVAVFLSNRVCVATPAEAAATQAGIKRLRPALHDAIYAQARGARR